MKALSTALPALALALALVATAHAQTAISDVTGLNGNNVIGDAPGWPITISVPGYFKLTSNLILSGSTTAIHITAPGVTLDLNGYTILGPVSCSAASGQVQCPVVHNPNTYGIYSTSDYTVVRNGRVRGFSAGGISIKSGVVENVQVESNDGAGITASSGVNAPPSRLSGVTSTLNNGLGVFTRNALIERAVLSSNQYGVGGYRFSLIDSLVVDNRIGGILDTGSNPLHHGAVKGTVLHSNIGPSISGTVRSLGGNLVDGVAF